MKRYRKIEKVVAGTFPGIHWSVRCVNDIYYGYLDGYKYKLPEIVTPEGTEAETVESIIRNLKFWFEFRCPSPEAGRLALTSGRAK